MIRFRRFVLLALEKLLQPAMHQELSDQSQKLKADQQSKMPSVKAIIEDIHPFTASIIPDRTNIAT